ncbi:MAG: AsmA family protein [Cytophagales bacterium]|nr:AsmA family protein [Cytophagales bacterium]
MKKKIAYFFGGFFLLIIAAIILIPFFFKDDIIRAIDKEIAKNINAEVHYNPDDFGLSLFSNFPLMTASMKNLTVTGKAPFAGDTLLSLGAFEATINLKSLLDDKIQVEGVSLDRPRINIIVMKNGQANYDIAKSAETADEKNTEESASESGSSLSVGIKEWQINKGELTYDDRALETLVKLRGLEHRGSGDFSQETFEMNSNTDIGGLSVRYGDVDYLEGNPLRADVTMLMDLANMKFTFRKNQIQLNDFVFGFDGNIGMKGDDILTDLTFASKQSTFKSVLSLVPGVFTKDFKDLKTKGTFTFSGKINGVYNEKRIPAFETGLRVRNGYVQYPDLPSAIEKINFSTQISNTTGIINDTKIKVPDFSMLMGQEKFRAALSLWEMDNIHWKLKANGGINLAVIAEALKLQDMNLKGLVLADFESKGKLSDVETKKYEKIHTKGKAEMKEFRFANKDLPQGFDIPYAQLTFNPKEIVLKRFQANIDKSDMQATGKLGNYLAFALQKDAVLHGQLDFSSNYFNLNQFMSQDSTANVSETPKAPVEETTAAGVIEIPKNIDFTLNARMKKVDVTNLKIENIKGKIRLNDGIVSMDGLNFDMLKGKVKMNGSYSTKNPAKPTFTYNLDLDKCSIRESYNTFQTVQKMSPIAKKIQGEYSADFNIRGLLLPDMKPKMETLQGGGEIYIKDAAILNSDIIGKINKLAKINSNNTRLENTRIKATIENGRVITNPFNIVIDKSTTTFSGSSDFEGNMDYRAEVLVPNKKLAKEANKFLSNLLGTEKELVGNMLRMDFSIKGKFDAPKVSLIKVTPVSGKKKKSGKENAEQISPKKEAQKKAEEELKKGAEKLKEQLKKWF